MKYVVFVLALFFAGYGFVLYRTALRTVALDRECAAIMPDAEVLRGRDDKPYCVPRRTSVPLKSGR